MSEGQVSAIADINNDLSNGKVMNRLVYGGCGAGKTAVLQYCLFLAYKNYFQSMLMCPSTILAEQHYNDVKELFKDYNINIELLISKTTPKNKQRIYKGAADGSIDIFIGTTSLCKKIEYKNLGILLIDEPQKFGVKAKTYIKGFQSNVNTLQTTGTPMPRDFLEIEAGVMNLSKIMTYPKGKKPIITNMIDDTDNNIKSIIQFELKRNGQIYFIYNDTLKQYEMRERLLKIMPELKICIINGKMNKKESSQVIEDFSNKKYDLMIATSIIETGVNIDINMILIYKPNVWGMTSLHQVRNRVGRFSKQGYCFLVEPKRSDLSPTAVKRLQTICKYNQLGQDILIAEQDRKNRGSGEIFGTRQSGRIPNIGYTMYKELLSKEIQEQKDELD
ncbi:helicase-related protein [Clostridium sp. JN-1]|uniref:helicase-related protein n=1 Tax=Clostridium sp. JN-1 TaxID=2483110 RepID=UPI000F0AF62D|nr:helicase-related protein [Clostridium sp. JN-1]